MKTKSWIALTLWILALPGGAQNLDQSVSPVVVERGPHHRVWQRTITETLPDGTSVERKSGYTELATGLHYQNERGEWLDSKEEIEIFQGAAVARQGQHQVVFAANLNTVGAITLLSPDGKRFRSHVLGLAYTDYASGQSVLIAGVKDSQGGVLGLNQVIYQDAFDGDGVMADVRYTYTKAGFEQDIILLTAPPSPAAYGFNPETTRLEVFTEFIEAPEATVTAVILKQESDPVARQQMAEPDLIDQRLDFGVMKMDQGQAFSLGDDPFAISSVPTGKSMERIDGRVFLIEKVDYPSIREHLRELPQGAAGNPQGRVIGPVNGRRLLAGLIPAAPKGAPGTWTEKQLAKVDPTRKGLVLDYITLNSSLTNYVFKGDTTYYITAAANFYGTTVIEGGTVVKGASVNLRGPLDCRTSAYRPATWTSTNDNTVGEIISGSTGSPSGYVVQISLFDTSSPYDLHDFRMSYGNLAVNGSVNANLSHFQLVKTVNAMSLFGSSVVKCRNFLFSDVTSRAFVLTSAATNWSEHGTFHRVSYFRHTTNSGLFALTNCLLISVTNNVVYTGTNVIFSLDDTGFFQTVGSGAHYLANNSTNRDAGTTNIDADLLVLTTRS